MNAWDFGRIQTSTNMYNSNAESQISKILKYF